MTIMQPVYIAAARRTPIGKLRGGLSGVRPDDLAAEVIRDLVAALPRLDPAEIEDVYWGNANGAGEENRNVARMAVLLAGGVESMSRAPFVVPRPDDALPQKMELFDTRLGWRLTNPRMRELHGVLSMGETAEEVAQRHDIARERQDAFALRSHQLAAAAWDAGHFDAEVLPITTEAGVEVVRDECIRADTSLEKLAGLRPVFRAGGSVTAGNSSPMNDGAAGLVLASEAGLAKLGVEPLARYVAGASAGVHPDIMGVGPIPAVGRVLARSGWKIEDVETAELNEAFAAQALAVVDGIGIDPDLVNPSGGAIALGHPLGCSGARIVTTLVHRLHRTGLRRGLAAMCVGVGQGTAVLIEGI